MEECLVESNERVVSLTEIFPHRDLISLDELKAAKRPQGEPSPTALRSRELRVCCGNFLAVRDVNLEIQARKVTAIIGPSGCGKLTPLRAFNRTNELAPSARSERQVMVAHSMQQTARVFDFTAMRMRG